MRRRMIASLCVAAALLVSSLSIQARGGGSSPLWSVTIERAGTVAASLRSVSTGETQHPTLAWAGSEQGLLLDMIDLRGVPTGWTARLAADDPQGLSLRPRSIRTWLGNSELGSMEFFTLAPVTRVLEPAWTTSAGLGDGLYTLGFDVFWPMGSPNQESAPITLILDLQDSAP